MAVVRRLLLAVLLGLGAILASPSGAGAQDGTTTTTVAELPPADIIPQPNSGHAPTEAGDRGGALQLGLLALVVVVITGAVWHLVRQSRRARSG
jgi:hypothetical protein